MDLLVGSRGEQAVSLVLKRLSAEYPQLYLNPDADTQETYRSVVLRGREPGKKTLDHFTGDANDCDETTETPAGPVRVITLGNRKDFELVLRGLMAAKEGPRVRIPDTQGAAMLSVFNWPRIHAHLAAYPKEQQAAEFKCFTSVKDNYIDQLVVLSRGPYSDVDAETAGYTEKEWLARSDTIRRYHELTHVICRRLYPDDIDPVRDELIADAVGMYTAFGHFDPEMEKLFLGIRDGQYVGGRMENYTDEPDRIVTSVSTELNWIRRVIDAQTWAGPFDLIPVLMNRQNDGKDQKNEQEEGIEDRRA